MLSHRLSAASEGEGREGEASVCPPRRLAAFQEGVGPLRPTGYERPLARLLASGTALHEGTGPTLGRHHDRDSPNPLQCGLADGVGAGVRQPWLPTDRAVAPDHLLRGRRRAGRHHQRLRGSRGRVAAVGVDGAGARAPRAGEGGLVGIVAVAEAGEGVCGVVGFGVVPVAAVVGVGGGQRVVLR